jgi:hypothetical protein
MRRFALPALAVVVAALAFEVGYGVALGDALYYLGYELGFVVLPGWAAYRALSRNPGGRLRQLALGWALGYVLEILAFMATAATGTRPLLFIYPLLVVAVAAVVIWRRGAGGSDSERGSGGAPEAGLPQIGTWLIGAVCILAIAYIALAYFPSSPLPGTESVSYFPDYPRWIALAADAKNHWPIMDPSVVGEPLPYHYFVNIHLAAASQVTGLGLPLLYLRLFIFPLVVVSVLLLVVAGRSLARSWPVGLIAAGLAFFVGELRLDASNTFLAHTPFFGLFFTFLFRSPSFLLGLVLFVPLVILVGERIRARPERTLVGEWILITLFMVGASDAKVTILPLLVAALALFAGWSWLSSRRISAGVWASAGLALCVAGTVWFLQYRGHESLLRLDPFADVNMMPAVHLIKVDLIANLAGFPGKDVLLDAGGVLFGLFGLLAAPLIGIIWVLRYRGLRLRPPQAWLLALLVAGLVLSLAVVDPDSQGGMYFLFYGLVAGYLLSAAGLWTAWQRRPSMAGRWLPAAGLAVAFAVVTAALIGLPTSVGLFTGPRANALTYMVRYAGLMLALVLLYAAGRRWLGPRRWGAAALVSVALLGVGALATPIDSLKPAIADSGSEGVGIGKTMTPGLYGALDWIRDETPDDSVVAVNNQWIDPGNQAPLEFIYSAFTERRVFLEGWGYSQRTRELGLTGTAGGANPFQDRLDLNEAAFDGDAHALETLARDYGVRYLIVDRLNGTPVDLDALRRSARVVYDVPEAVVFELPAA